MVNPSKENSRKSVTEQAVTNVIQIGGLIELEGVEYCIRRFEGPDAIRVTDLATRLDHVFSLASISAGAAPSAAREDLSEISDARWAIGLGKLDAIRRVAAGESIEDVARDVKKGTSTLYKWISIYSRTGSVTGLMRAIRNDKHASRISKAQKDAIDSVIEKHFLTVQKKSPAEGYRQLELYCRVRHIPLIAMSTWLRQLQKILPIEKARKRGHRHKASRLNAITGAFKELNTPLSMYQIDHVLVDLELVDEVHRIPIGKAWLTVAIDVVSRTVPGWYLSLDPPGSLGTGMCIAQAILPKGSVLAEMGVPYQWPCQGFPGVVHADNAGEFHGNMLDLACHQHGFTMKYRMLKRPEYGAHIERLAGTLMGRIKALPGATFSNPKEREDYDSEKHAAFTLSNLNKWIAHLILGDYHNREHSSLDGQSPLQRYSNGILGGNESPGIGAIKISADPERLRIDFLPFEKRTIQAEGVDIDSITYQGPQLARWVGAKDPKSSKHARKFIFRRDPRDISAVLFFDPELSKYFRIPYENPNNPAISLWELKAIKAYMKKHGPDRGDDKSVFLALKEMQSIETDEVAATKKARRDRERKAHHNRADVLHRNVSPMPSPSPSTIENDTYGDDVVAFQLGEPFR